MLNHIVTLLNTINTLLTGHEPKFLFEVCSEKGQRIKSPLGL